MKSRLSSCLLAAFIASACAQSDLPADSFGLPLIEITMTDDQLGRLNASYNDKSTFSARVQVDGGSEDVRVNYAGRTTLDAWKKSWDLLFKHDPSEGIYGRKWRLSATPDDPTFLRSLVGYRLFQAAGFYTPHIRPVALYLNGTYQGLYLQKELVDEDFFLRRANPLRSLYKAQYNDKALDERALTLTSDFFAAKYHAYQAPGGDKNWSDLRALLRQMIAAPDSTRSDIDHESLYRYHAVTVALNNWDGFSNNFFLYKGAHDTAFSFQPWDLDRAFERSADAIGLVGDDAWGRYIASDPDRLAVYLEHLAKILTIMEDSEFSDGLQADADIIKAAWEQDRLLTAKSESFDTAVAKLKHQIEERAAYLRNARN